MVENRKLIVTGLLRGLSLWFLAATLLAGCTSSSHVEAPFVASLDQIEQSLDEGDLPFAMAGLNTVQADGLQNLRTLALAARMHSVTERDDALRGVVEQILTIDPTNAYGLEQMGLIRLSEGELGAAENYLTLAIANDPSRWMAWNGLGIVADADAQFDKAQTSFRRALKIVPGHPKVLANLGWSLLLDEEYEDAESLLREALEIAPDAITTQSNLAFCIALQGRYEEAMTVYQELYETPVAANNVGYAAMVRDDLSSARKYLNMALELQPNYYRKAANNLADVD